MAKREQFEDEFETTLDTRAIAFLGWEKWKLLYNKLETELDDSSYKYNIWHEIENYGN